MVQGSSRGGFLNVESILGDPRTTRDPLHLENLGIQTEEVKPKPEDVQYDPEKATKHKLRVKNDLKMKNLEKNEDFQSVMNYNSHFKPHITKDIYNEGFTVGREEACDHSDTDILLTVMVISAPDHFQQRAAIRSTWGRSVAGGLVTFLLGEAEDEAARAEVMRESEAHQDLVINKIPDLYQNLSLKTLSAFQWLLRFCSASSFLLKVDDDMFVQVDKVLAKIKNILQQNSHPRLILGNISRGWRPVRNPQSKYLITAAQYAADTYPDFATGPSYLLSRAAVAEILPAALEAAYLHLEDVFLTGVVAESLGIQRVDEEEFKNNAVRVPAQFMGCTIQRSVTIHKVDPEEQAALLQLARSPDCGRSKQTRGRLSPNMIALQTRQFIKTALKNKE